MSAAGARTKSGAAAFGVASDAGLVPSKTSLDLTNLVNLSPSAVAERRVKRLKKSVWASGHLHGIAEDGFRPSKAWFVTLTYAQANGWRADHISNAVQAFRKWCMARGYPCRYTWVAEIQPKRLISTGHAVVHYHLLAWLPVGVSMPQWDRPTKTPSGRHRDPFWVFGMTNTEQAKSGVGYLMKYLSKLGELTRFPRGLRLYGIGGLNEQGRKVRFWLNLPEWAKCCYGVGELVRKKSSLVVLATGEILAAAFAVRLVPSGLLVQSLRPIPERFHSGAYSSVSFI